MRKNILGAVVIFFVTLAFLLMLDDITNYESPNTEMNVEVYDADSDQGKQSEMATIDVEE